VETMLPWILLAAALAGLAYRRASPAPNPQLQNYLATLAQFERTTMKLPDLTLAQQNFMILSAQAQMAVFNVFAAATKKNDQSKLDRILNLQAQVTNGLTIATFADVNHAAFHEPILAMITDINEDNFEEQIAKMFERMDQVFLKNHPVYAAQNIAESHAWKIQVENLLERASRLKARISPALYDQILAQAEKAKGHQCDHCEGFVRAINRGFDILDRDQKARLEILV
jgi:hypothetical protein